jgi:hypothetical protein
MILSVTFLYVFNRSDIHTLAFLYTDPGSGALVWQLLVASFFGGLFYVRSFIRRITAKMSGGRNGKQSDQQAAVDQIEGVPAGSTTPNGNRLP